MGVWRTLPHVNHEEASQLFDELARHVAGDVQDASAKKVQNGLKILMLVNALRSTTVQALTLPLRSMK